MKPFKIVLSIAALATTTVFAANTGNRSGVTTSTAEDPATAGNNTTDPVDTASTGDMNETGTTSAGTDTQSTEESDVTSTSQAGTVRSSPSPGQQRTEDDSISSDPGSSEATGTESDQ